MKRILEKKKRLNKKAVTVSKKIKRTSYFDPYKAAEIFEILAENYPNGSISLIDKNLRFIYTGGSGYKLFGINPHDFIGKSIAIALDKKVFRIVKKALPKVLKGEAITHEVEFHGHYFLNSYKPFSLKGKVIDSFVLTSQNITALKQAQFQQEKLFSVVHRSLNEIYIFSEKTLLFEYVNEGALKNLGFSMREMLSMSPLDIKPDYNLETFNKLIEPLRNGKEPNIIFETVHRRANGSVYPVEVHLQQVTEGNRKVFVAIILDITQKRENEKSIQAKNEEMASIIEELNASQEELIEQNNQLQLLEEFLNKAHDSIQVSDESGRLIYINKASSERLGIPTNQVHNYYVRNFEPLFKSDDDWKAHVALLKEKGSVELTSVNFNLKNNQSFPVEVNVTHQVVAGRGYVIASSRDISDRIKAKAEAVESREMLLNISNNIPGLVMRYVVNPDGTDNVLFVSKGAELLWEVPLEEMLKDSSKLWSKIHPDDLAGMIETVQESAKTLRRWQYEYRAVMTDGRVKWISAVGTPKKQMDGSILWHSIALDVTALRSAEDQLKYSEVRYKNLIDNATVGIVVHKPDTTIVLSNPVACSILGLTHEQMLGKVAMDPYWKFLTLDRKPLPLDLYPVNKILMDRQPLKDYIIGIQISKQVTPKWVICNGTLIYKTNGELDQVIIVFSEITERIEMENQLKKTIVEKDVLFRELHHRIKNNLQMVSSLLYLKALSAPEESTLSFISETKARILSISLLHEQLLQLRGLDRLDIKTYLEQLITNVANSYGRSGDIKIEPFIESHILNIDIVVNLGLLVNELLSNSIKHAYPSGDGGRISLDFKKQFDKFNLVVQDFGVGIPSEFTTGTARSYGMQLINLFASQLKGKLEISSLNGTKFLLTFPASEKSIDS